MASASATARWSLVFAVLYIVAGVIAIATPLFVTLFAISFLGVLLTVSGLAGLVHAFYHRGWGGFAVQLLAAILATVMGILLMVDAGAGALVITLIMAVYFLIGGCFKTSFAISHPQLVHRGSLIFSGVISVLLGILIIVHWPSSALWVIGTFIGIDLIFYGFALLSASRKLA